MQIPGGLDGILGKIGNNVKSGFRKIKEFPKYLDERLREIRDKISEYGPIIENAAIASSPLYVKALWAGLHIKGTHKGPVDKLLGYVLIGVGVTAVGLGIMFGLNAIHSLPSSNHVQYLGSPNGYEAFVPHDTINYNGHIDPEGDLILNNGTILHNTILDGQYSNTINQNHNQIVQLNNQVAGQNDPVNHQPYLEDMQDFYGIKGQVPVEQVTINGQTYYVIDADKINPANIAGFYTYDKWVPNFVAAMNTPGTYAAVLPVSSPVFNWANTTGTVAELTIVYQDNIRGFVGRAVLVQPNELIIPYGINTNIPPGTYLLNFTNPKQIYNPSN